MPEEEMERSTIGKRDDVSEERRIRRDRARAPSQNRNNGREATRVYVLRLKEETTSPSIILSSKDLNKETEFLVDTGSELNILKIKMADGDLMCNENDKVKLSGITDETVTTYGSVTIHIHGYPLKFQLVPNSFPIPYDGILGSDFLQRTGKIDYEKESIEWHGIIMPFVRSKEITIPGRTSNVCKINVKNNELETGYLPRLDFGEGIYAGEAVVSNNQGKAYIRIFNTNDTDVNIRPPSVTLEEFEINNAEPLSHSVNNTPQEPLLEPKDINSPISTSPKLKQRDETQYTILPAHIIPSKSCKCINQTDERYALALQNINLDGLNDEERLIAKDMIRTSTDLFHLPGDRLTYSDTVTHKIETVDSIPVNVRQYRFPPIHKEEINKQIGELLENDVIKPSTSPYNSPLWIVPKKPDAKGNKRWRLVIDYRMLNEKTIKDSYPLPNITEILDQLGSAKYFSTFDLASGFHQIGMDKEDAPKTAFSTPFGHYEFKRMPFGLKNAPSTFQRLMNSVLTGLQGNELFVYLDDIVIYSSSLREHLIKYQKLCARLRDANLKLQPEKCNLLRKEVVYLGHIISADGVKPDPGKIEAVKNFPTPKNAKNIKQFLGLAGYYRRFIPNFSGTSKPLTNLLRKDVPFKWEDAQSKAFKTLANLLCEQPLLQFPDFTRPFLVTTDASNYAIGGILSQGEIGKDLPIAYTSRILNQAEQNYSTIEKELLAIIYAVNYFRPYLYGHKFSLITDHRPLVWLNSVKDPTSRLIRWRLKLAEYEYDIVYKAGKRNVNADALSRNPIGANKQILPIAGTSSSDDEIFSSLAKRRRTQELPKSEIALETETPNVNINEQTNDTDETNDDEPDYSRYESNVIEIKDRITMHKGHIAFFVTKTGTPIDKGAKELADNNKLPSITDVTLGRVKISKRDNRYLIALPVQERTSVSIQLEILDEVLHSLLDAAIELNLKTIAISRDNIADISWINIKRKISSIFAGHETKIIILKHEITIPREIERIQIIHDNHATPVGGHKGVNKTYWRIKQRYYWPSIKTDVQHFIQNCRSCQTKKLVRQKTKQPMTLTDTPGRAFDKVSMDIVGPMPTSKLGNNYILTMQDLLTKYSIAVPLQQASSVEVADAFIKNLICKYGSPKGILTDQGTAFLSELMKAVAKKFKIETYQTTAYRPQSNGSIERSHHVLAEFLKHFIKDNSEWDDWVDIAMFSYNTSIHEGTQYTPHELIFGQLAKTPNDSTRNDLKDETYASYLGELTEQLQKSQEAAKENLERAKIKSKGYYDKKQKVVSFSTGDSVYLLKGKIKGKLDSQYEGPYKIVQILNNNNVKIETPKGLSVVHTDRLKLNKAKK